MPLVPDPSPFEEWIGIVKLKRNKSPSCEQTSTELFQVEDETWSEIHKLIWNMDQRNEFIIVPIY
jgi:hypothetical protein